MQEKRNKFYLLVLLVFILAILVFIVSLFSNEPKEELILEKKEIPITLSIGNRTAFNITKDSISFGILSKGSSSSREDINIINNYEFPIILDVSIEGSVREFINYETNIYFKKNESKNLIFSTITITNQSYGDYTGKAVIIFKRAK